MNGCMIVRFPAQRFFVGENDSASETYSSSSRRMAGQNGLVCVRPRATNFALRSRSYACLVPFSGRTWDECGERHQYSIIAMIAAAWELGGKRRGLVARCDDACKPGPGRKNCLAILAFTACDWAEWLFDRTAAAEIEHRVDVSQSLCCF